MVIIIVFAYLQAPPYFWWKNSLQQAVFPTANSWYVSVRVLLEYSFPCDGMPKGKSGGLDTVEGESDSNVLPETTGSSWMYGQQSADPSTTGGMYFRGKDGHRIKSHTLFFSPPPPWSFWFTSRYAKLHPHRAHQANSHIAPTPAKACSDQC